MPFTNLPNGATSFGIPLVGGFPYGGGPVYFVKSGGTGNGSSIDQPLSKISTASTLLGTTQGGLILVLPSDTALDDNFTISQNYTTVACLGPPKSAAVLPTTAPTTTTATVTGYKVCMIGMDISTGTGATTRGLLVNGDGFKAYDCKFECGDNLGIAIDLVPSATALLTASDGLLEGCEVAWCAKGIRTNLSTSAVTQFMISRTRFHNCTTWGIGEEISGSGTVRNFEVADCIFDRNEDGSEPTDYIILNRAININTNTGIVTRSSFPTAINGGKNTVSTSIIWASNFMSGGISAAQPS